MRNIDKEKKAFAYDKKNGEFISETVVRVDVNVEDYVQNKVNLMLINLILDSVSFDNVESKEALNSQLLEYSFSELYEFSVIKNNADVDADIDSIHKENPPVYIQPAGITLIEVNAEKKDFARCFDIENQEWIYKEDHREKKFYHKENQQIFYIDELGEVDEKLTELEPKDLEQKWNAEKNVWAWDVDLLANNTLNALTNDRDAVLKGITARFGSTEPAGWPSKDEEIKSWQIARAKAKEADSSLDDAALDAAASAAATTVLLDVVAPTGAKKRAYIETYKPLEVGFKQSVGVMEVFRDKYQDVITAEIKKFKTKGASAAQKDAAISAIKSTKNSLKIDVEYIFGSPSSAPS